MPMESNQTEMTPNDANESKVPREKPRYQRSPKGGKYNTRNAEDAKGQSRGPGTEVAVLRGRPSHVVVVAV